MKDEESMNDIEPHDEHTLLNYLKWQPKFYEEKPYEVLSQVPEGLDQANFTLESGQPQVIHDLRGQEDDFNMDDNGFAIIHQDIPHCNFDTESIEKIYLPSIHDLLQEIDPGCESFIFDWKMRSTDQLVSKPPPGSKVDFNDPMLRLEPARIAHNDQTPNGALKRAKQAIGNRPDLLQRRWRIINVWRPISSVVLNYPLAVCDGSTVPKDKLIHVDHVRKQYIGESFYLLPSEEYKWYYLNHQAPHEVLLLKIYDSSDSVKSKCCPHTSFKQCCGPSFNVTSRESIEVRTVVFSAS